MSVIWVEGIIGAGKTTLTKGLAEQLQLRPLLEPVETNPFLAKFYNDPKGYAFPMQMHLMGVRYNLQKLALYESLAKNPDHKYRGAVLDRGLPGDRVFCKLHIKYGNIPEDHWQIYENFYNLMSTSIQAPSVLVYLQVDPEVALSRVRKRDRDVESSLPLSYLKDLAAGYESLLAEIESGDHAWSNGIKVLRLPWNEDVTTEDESQAAIQKAIEAVKRISRL
jgi:NADH dehydrogenase (ubiquinone) 1 alpha subcomplex subunit 10